MNGMAHLWIVLCLLLISGSLWIYVRVLRPLRRLAAQSAQLTGGDLNALHLSCGGIREIDDIRRAMAGMVGHIRRTQDEGLVYRDALTNGQEAERTRLAHELHDDTVQAFIAIGQSIDLAIQLGDVAPKAAEVLKSARAQAVEAVDNLRRLIADLRPPALEELGLVPALRMMRLANIDLRVDVDGVERRLDEEQELTLFRVAQEAVRNAWRHGRASQVTLHVDYAPHHIQLIIHDNGHGFVLPDSPDCFAAEGHYGLLGIQERVRDLNGTVSIDSAPGHGTRIQVELPTIPTPQPDDVVRDPVCSALIRPQQAYGSVVYDGQRYYFCCPVCQGEFQRSPQTYLQVPSIEL
ncbi:MAG: histidine kinase [bacterium]|nr:histidine kinase [bacterium]